MNLRQYVQIVRRRASIIVAVTLVALGVAAAYTYNVTPQYASTAQLFVSTPQSADAADGSPLQGALFSEQRVASYARQVETRDLASRVIDELQLDVTPGQLLGSVEAAVVPDTVIISITFTDPDPRYAQSIAQTYAEELSTWVAVTETPPGGSVPPIKATVSDPAALPLSPVSPNTPRNLALALVIGLLLGFGSALLRDTLDTTIKTADDVAAITDTPALAAIAFDPATRTKPLITSWDSHAPRVEAFRVLRTNLQFVDVDKANKIFVVTSSVPGEGKTTTAVNLALALAQAGQRTLLMEGDLRRPRASTTLDMDGSVGVTTVLVRRVSVEEAIQKHPQSDLHVLAAGATPPNPAELLQSHAMNELLDTLRDQYDVIIIDAPPLLPVTDAAILSSLSDGALLVVRHGKTTKAQLEQSVRRLRQVSAEPVGVVMNMVRTSRWDDDSYGYGYGYGYGPTSAVAADESTRPS